jgi:methylenetetrahydrofolate reductase (NADPH)
MCKAKLPTDFVSKLSENEDVDWQFQVGVEQARQQTQGLIDAGVPGIHFYVLNKSMATNLVLERVTGLKRAVPA